MMSKFFLLLVVLFAVGCGGGVSSASRLPAPLQSTTVGPGDVFEVNLVGEKELPKEYRVQPDGSIDFPYISRVMVSGLEPQDISSLIKQKLVEAKILRDPQVSVLVKQYNSKKVTIIGQVTKPGSVPWTDGMKLVDAISMAGWFTSIAASKSVIVNRVSKDGKTTTITVSVDAITDGAQPDIPLQSGDTIKVEQRVF